MMNNILKKACYNASFCEVIGAYSNFRSLRNLKKEAMEILAEEIRGKKLIITTLENKPLSYTEMINGKLVGKGAAFQLIKYLQQKYEFQYSVVAATPSILGDNSTGVLGMLNSDKADVAAAFLPVIRRYWSFIRYSPSLDMGDWAVLMRRPAESATGSGLLAPFTFDVWLAIMASVICVGPMFYSIMRLQKKVCKNVQATNANIYTCCWFVYGALLKQGTTIIPMSDSSRLLLATWWIFITILTAFYTANLTAFLTLSQFTLPVNSPDDIGSSKYSWVTRKGNAIEEAAKNVNEELHYSLEGSHPLYVNETNDVILHKYIEKRNLLHLGEKPIVEHMLYRDYLKRARKNLPEVERCTFVIAKWPVLLRERAFVYSKNFKYAPLFDYALGHLIEGGIIKYNVREGLPNIPICPLDLGSTDRQLKNADLILTYYIVGGGFASSGIVFVIELLIKFTLLEKKKPKSHDEPSFGAPPPSYHTLFGAPFNYDEGQKKNINGRDYWVVKSDRGPSDIVPIRTTSALLFQYTH